MRQTLCLLLISVIPIALAEPGLADLGDKTIKIGEPCGTQSTSPCEKGSTCTYSPDGFKCKSSIPNIVIAKESESCEHPDLKCDDGLLCLIRNLPKTKDF